MMCAPVRGTFFRIRVAAVPCITALPCAIIAPTKGGDFVITFDITHESEALLKLLYAVYVGRRAEGKGRAAANDFGSTQDIRDVYLKNMCVDDVTALCCELRQAGCISAFDSDDMLVFVQLTSDAIVYGEQTYKRNAHELLTWVSSIGGLLPF